MNPTPCFFCGASTGAVELEYYESSSRKGAAHETASTPMFVTACADCAQLCPRCRQRPAEMRGLCLNCEYAEHDPLEGLED